jgi:hypothetical protein
LRSVRRAFGFTVKGPVKTIDIDDVSIDLPALDAPRFIQCYVTNACVLGGPNVAHAGSLTPGKR